VPALVPLISASLVNWIFKFPQHDHSCTLNISIIVISTLKFGYFTLRGTPGSATVITIRLVNVIFGLGMVGARCRLPCPWPSLNFRGIARDIDRRGERQRTTGLCELRSAVPIKRRTCLWERRMREDWVLRSESAEALLYPREKRTSRKGGESSRR
jgi:hypothetical protein